MLSAVFARLSRSQACTGSLVSKERKQKQSGGPPPNRVGARRKIPANFLHIAFLSEEACVSACRTALIFFSRDPFFVEEPCLPLSAVVEAPSTNFSACFLLAHLLKSNCESILLLRLMQLPNPSSYEYIQSSRQNTCAGGRGRA